MEARRIDVLRTEIFGEFHEDDVVRINLNNSRSKCFVGRIQHIKTLELTLDTSDIYLSHIVTLKYDEIFSIVGVNNASID